MARILFIDDNRDLGKFTKDRIEESGEHTVDWFGEDAWEITAKRIEAFPDKSWDLLLLDIHYPTDEWGGLWLYNSLVRGGIGKSWEKRVIVYSQYFVENMDWSKVRDSQMLALRIFLDTANIPYDCALPNQDFDRATLLEKIEEVLKR